MRPAWVSDALLSVSRPAYDQRVPVDRDDDRCEFNELALVDLGVSLDEWHALTAGERIALLTRWFNAFPPRSRREARAVLGVTRAQWGEMGSAARYEAALAAMATSG